MRFTLAAAAVVALIATVPASAEHSGGGTHEAERTVLEVRQDHGRRNVRFVGRMLGRRLHAGPGDRSAQALVSG